MKVIILCGGEGTRIRDASDIRPKPLLEVGQKPILWHIMKTYSHYGHDDFILALGYLGNQIKNFFLNYQTISSDFTINLGSLESVKLHSDCVEKDWNVTCANTGEKSLTGCRIYLSSKYIPVGEDFMVTYGDGVADIDINRVIEFHKNHNRIGTIVGVRPVGRFGELETDVDSRVTSFSEKPQSADMRINGGFMVFKYSFIERYLSGKEDQILEKEPLMNLAKDGELMMYPHNGFWQPMDTLREYLFLNELWKSGNAPWKAWSE
jgi:glucose-1-phosphate cytidylyltransferase